MVWDVYDLSSFTTLRKAGFTTVQHGYIKTVLLRIGGGGGSRVQYTDPEIDYPEGDISWISSVLPDEYT
jgi:hypothetical protein